MVVGERVGHVTVGRADAAPPGSSTVELVDRARQHTQRTAIVCAEGTYGYGQLLRDSTAAAARLLGEAADLDEARVAFLTPRSYCYVAVQWASWRAGGVAVPLGESYPRRELEYVIDDAAPRLVVAHPSYLERLGPIARARGLPLLRTDELSGSHDRAGASVRGSRELPVVATTRAAMILYTSGTTSRPKGVVISHANLEAQQRSLVQAWEWRETDRIIHVLPLNHVHGIVNALGCCLWAGATCDMLPRFDAHQVWDRIERGGATLLMGVPTMYAKLLAAADGYPVERQRDMHTACQALRLMVSGSAALPVDTFARWHQLTGHALLERYGMTEIGMALSNPVRGERRPGFVGTPLPAVRTRIVDEGGRPVAPGTEGELEVRGPAVFHQYWRQPEATAAAFRDGWFRTGDIAVVERGYHRIIGRRSVDIIKSGGFKLSALEIEAVLHDHPAIEQVAVVGVADPQWGERLCAAVVLQPEAALTLDGLRAWCQQRLAACKIPTRLLVLSELPCNALGKVTKPRLRQLFERNS